MQNTPTQKQVLPLNQTIILSAITAVCFLANGCLSLMEADYSTGDVVRMVIWLSIGFLFALQAFFGYYTSSIFSPKILIVGDQIHLKNHFLVIQEMFLKKNCT